MKIVPLRYNVRSVVERLPTSLMTALGIGFVAMMFVLLFGFLDGLKQVLLNAEGNQRWIVISRGITSESVSSVSHAEVEIIRSRPEIQITAGAPLVSPEMMSSVNVTQDKRFSRFVTLRGVQPIALLVHDHMKLLSGRWPVRGEGEWVIGRTLDARASFLRIGSRIHFGRRNWQVVGVYSDNNSARESEIWTTFEDLKTDAQARDMDTNSVHVVIRPGLGSAFAQALKSDGRVKLRVMSEKEYYSREAKVTDQVRWLGMIVGVALGLGAAFGGMNTMYAAVARRQREIGVLRTLGFSRAAILGSFVLESSMIGLVGGIIGIVLALIVAQLAGLSDHLMLVGSTLFSYSFGLSGAAVAIAAAVTIGIAGGLPPAIKASRVPILVSLRDV